MVQKELYHCCNALFILLEFQPSNRVYELYSFSLSFYQLFNDSLLVQNTYSTRIYFKIKSVFNSYECFAYQLKTLAITMMALRLIHLFLLTVLISLL